MSFAWPRGPSIQIRCRAQQLGSHQNRSKPPLPMKWSGPGAYATRKVPHLTWDSCTQQLGPCGLVLLVGTCFFDHYRSNVSSSLEQQPSEKQSRNAAVAKEWGLKSLFTWFALTPKNQEMPGTSNLNVLEVTWSLFQSAPKQLDPLPVGALGAQGLCTAARSGSRQWSHLAEVTLE